VARVDGDTSDAAVDRVGVRMSFESIPSMLADVVEVALCAIAECWPERDAHTRSALTKLK